MIVHVYTFCRDEELLLPYFFKNYDFAEKIICFFDTYSKDNSLDIINSNPKCERIDFDFGGKYRDDFLMFAKNSEWKMSIGKADWVIIVDLDEFVYHPDGLLNYLKECKEKSISIPLTEGFEMHSDTLPEGEKPIIDQIKFGTANERFNKKCVFDPNAVENIFYRPGSHDCDPEGNIAYSDKAQLKLLHYKYIGGLDRITSRWNTFGNNLSEENKKYGWSIKRLEEKNAIDRYHYIKQRKNKVI